MYYERAWQKSLPFSELNETKLEVGDVRIVVLYPCLPKGFLQLSPEY